MWVVLMAGGRDVAAVTDSGVKGLSHSLPVRCLTSAASATHISWPHDGPALSVALTGTSSPFLPMWQLRQSRFTSINSIQNCHREGLAGDLRAQLSLLNPHYSAERHFSVLKCSLPCLGITCPFSLTFNCRLAKNLSLENSTDI